MQVSLIFLGALRDNISEEDLEQYFSGDACVTDDACEVWTEHESSQRSDFVRERNICVLKL